MTDNRISAMTVDGRSESISTFDETNFFIRDKQTTVNPFIKPIARRQFSHVMKGEELVNKV